MNTFKLDYTVTLIVRAALGGTWCSRHVHNSLKLSLELFEYQNTYLWSEDLRSLHVHAHSWGGELHVHAHGWGELHVHAHGWVYLPNS